MSWGGIRYIGISGPNGWHGVWYIELLLLPNLVFRLMSWWWLQCFWLSQSISTFRFIYLLIFSNSCMKVAFGFLTLCLSCPFRHYLFILEALVFELICLLPRSARCPRRRHHIADAKIATKFPSVRFACLTGVVRARYGLASATSIPLPGICPGPV